VEQPVAENRTTAKSIPVAYTNYVRNVCLLTDKVAGHRRVFYKCVGYSRETSLIVAQYPHIEVKDAVGEVVMVWTVNKVWMNG
jgi:hypothetical protein